MQGTKTITPKIMYQVHLDDLVPKDNFYRKLDSELNFQFLYKATLPYYGTEGNESIDPVVFFKICLVGYLNNINSDRKLIEYCGNCLDVRLFIRYDIDEELPWHSTISRTRQLYGDEVFLALFKKVLSLCISKGMVRGKRQAIDSAHIKANASMDSLKEKPVESDAEEELLKDAEAYVEELNDHSEYKIQVDKQSSQSDGQAGEHGDKAKEKVTSWKKKSVEQHHAWKAKEYAGRPGTGIKAREDEKGNLIRPRFLSNHTHYSPTDPDARISVKPGKARQLNYLGQIAVDDSHHVITGAAADYADKRDSECLAGILEQTIKNLEDEQIMADQITADTGYSSGESLRYLEHQEINAYIPNFGQYKPHREGFIYNAQKDQYECQRGNKAILVFKKFSKSHDNYMLRLYRSSSKACRCCALKAQCIGKSDFKAITDSTDKPLYDRMHEKMQTAYAKRILRIRSATVEPVLGTLLNFLNMRRVNTRGIEQANKHVLMAALTYNLKKYMRFFTKKTVAKAQEIYREGCADVKTAFLGFIRMFLPVYKFSIA